jgi:hypothetical protein
MEETMFVQSETLRVRSQIKAGLPRQNRCDETGSLRVRTRISAGRIR